jgi:midasin (ATPase involved in ribosome maturation)
MGLGDGAGEKDVSEQIESEEQLEEARPKGEENTADHEDCKAC